MDVSREKVLKVGRGHVADFSFFFFAWFVGKSTVVCFQAHPELFCHAAKSFDMKQLTLVRLFFVFFRG